MWRLFLSGPGSGRPWTKSRFHPHWLLRHQDWMHHLRNLMVFLHQSHQGIYGQLVPFLILSSHRLLLASNLISYGARLESCLCLCLWQAKLIWYFSSHLAVFGFWSHWSHQITSLWILPTGKQIRVPDLQTGNSATAHATLDAEQIFLIPEHFLLIPLLG